MAGGDTSLWVRASPGSHGLSHPQAGAGQPGSNRAAPALGAGHLCGDRDGLKPGQHVGPVGGPSSATSTARQGRLWRAGDWPCCGITGAGADGPVRLTWGPGLWAGWGGVLGS